MSKEKSVKGKWYYKILYIYDNFVYVYKMQHLCLTWRYFYFHNSLCAQNTGYDFKLETEL